MQDHWFDVKQAAAFLGVSGSLVRRYCREGRFGFKLGSRWAITRAELEAFDAIPRRVGKPRKGEGEQ